MTVDAAQPATMMRRSLREGGQGRADAVGRAAQTAHQLRAPIDEEAAEGMWSVAREAARHAPPRLSHLRVVTITTDSPGSFAEWVQSLRDALLDAGWVRGSSPQIEVLRVANDADSTIDGEHQRVCAEGVTIHTAPVAVHRRPLPLAEARPFAFRSLRDLGWVPSPRMPVWSLDEDFRFQTLSPSPSRMFVLRSGGPLLHRVDALAAEASEGGADAIVGGNTGAAPVPALGLLLSQLRDLASMRDCSSVQGPAALALMSQMPDAYYDLADRQVAALRVPLMRAWWRADGRIDAFELTSRLRAGLPLTRPALAMPLGTPPNAWGHHEEVSVAGGNTLLLSPRALDGDFSHATCGDLISRRSDTTWCIAAQERGARVVRACLPLFHARSRLDRSPSAAAREALADALGFGVYRAMLAGKHEDEEEVLTAARARLSALRAALREAEATASRITLQQGAFEQLASWISLARAALHLPATKLSFFAHRA